MKGGIHLQEYDHEMSDELYHYGRKGMKWGQHIFGKVKEAGSKVGRGIATGASKAGKGIANAARKRKAEKQLEKLKKKPIKDLNDEELKERINRLQLEKQAFDLQRGMSSLDQKHISTGKKLLTEAGNSVLKPALIDAGKAALTKYFRKQFGVDTSDVTNTLDLLKKEGKKLADLSDADISKLGKRAENVKNIKKQLLGEDDDDSDNSGDEDSNNNLSSGSSNKPNTSKTSNGSNSETKVEPKTKSSKPTSETVSSGKSTVDRLFESGFRMATLDEIEKYAPK